MRQRLNPCPTRPTRAGATAADVGPPAPSSYTRAWNVVLVVLALAGCVWIAGYQVPIMPARLGSAAPLAEEELPPGASVGKWASFLQLIQAINSTTEFEYFILRNWEGMPASSWRGTHGDVDIYVSSRAAFAQFVGCEYGGKGGVECIVSCRDGKLVHMDVHGPDEDYVPRQWGLHMLQTRFVSTPAAASAGLGGVYRASDVDYFYSLLYHFTYHGKTFVKEDYVPVLQELAAAIGASGWNNQNLRALPRIKDHIDAFLVCRGYTSTHAQFNPSAAFVASENCVQ